MNQRQKQRRKRGVGTCTSSENASKYSHTQTLLRQINVHSSLSAPQSEMEEDGGENLPPFHDLTRKDLYDFKRKAEREKFIEEQAELEDLTADMVQPSQISLSQDGEQDIDSEKSSCVDEKEEFNDLSPEDAQWELQQINKGTRSGQLPSSSTFQATRQISRSSELSFYRQRINVSGEDNSSSIPLLIERCREEGRLLLEDKYESLSNEWKSSKLHKVEAEEAVEKMKKESMHLNCESNLYKNLLSHLTFLSNALISSEKTKKEGKPHFHKVNKRIFDVSTLKTILKMLNEWSHSYPKTFNDTFASLSIPTILSPFIEVFVEEYFETLDIFTVPFGSYKESFDDRFPEADKLLESNGAFFTTPYLSNILKKYDPSKMEHTRFIIENCIHGQKIISRINLDIEERFNNIFSEEHTLQELLNILKNLILLVEESDGKVDVNVHSFGLNISTALGIDRWWAGVEGFEMIESFRDLCNMLKHKNNNQS